MSQVLFCIAWSLPAVNGYVQHGCGQFIFDNENVAQNYVNVLNREHPEIRHWVVRQN
jgi:hypothetical protein